MNHPTQAYCTDHSFWEVKDGHICAGLPPNDSTPMQGWKHVTAGGKETCQGDFGAPLICDIAGTVTLIGINSDGGAGFVPVYRISYFLLFVCLPREGSVSHIFTTFPALVRGA